MPFTQVSFRLRINHFPSQQKEAAMLAYIDESRCSGTASGNRYGWTQVIAILSESDVQASLQKALNASKVSNANAPNDGPSGTKLQAGALLDSLFGQLEAQGEWRLFWARIDNSYAVSTWLVDVIFGSQDDLDITRWYQDEVGRHSLCLAIDGAMTVKTRARLDKARAERNRAQVISCLKNIWVSVLHRVSQENVRRIIKRAFDLASRDSRCIHFSSFKVRIGTEDETATAMTCVTLLQEIASFLKENGKDLVQVKAKNDTPVSATMLNLFTLTNEIYDSLDSEYLYAIGLDPGMLDIGATITEDAVAEEMMERLGDLFRFSCADIPLIALRKKYPKRITEYVVSRIASEMLLRDRLAMTRH
jgi:hypothetical protein